MQVLIAISGFCGFCYRIGNTPCTTPFDFLFVISIHVPAWGTTADVSKTDSTFQKDFNPRSRVGNDGEGEEYGDILDISIHIPTWGTTIASIPDIASFPFQPTFPRGERPTPLTEVTRATLNFNPRSRVGNDKASSKPSYSWGISILVPAWGTTNVKKLCDTEILFQSTFPRGERPRPRTGI